MSKTGLEGLQLLIGFYISGPYKVTQRGTPPSPFPLEKSLAVPSSWQILQSPPPPLSLHLTHPFMFRGSLLPPSLSGGPHTDIPLYTDGQKEIGRKR